MNLAILIVILQFHYHVNSLYLPDTPSCISTSRLISFSGNTECWKRHLAGEIGSAGVRLVSSDHGLFHGLNRRRALILINPDTSLIGPLETKHKEKQKNFQKDEANFKMSSTMWQSFCIAATLTGGVYLPVGVVTLHNSSLAQLGWAWPQTRGPFH